MWNSGAQRKSSYVNYPRYLVIISKLGELKQ